MPTTTKQTDAQTHGRETHRVLGDNLLAKVKELLHEGNVRRIIIRDDHERRLIEIPLGLGLGVALLAPVWAAIGAVAAMVTDCSVEVVRREDEDAPPAVEETPEPGAGPEWRPFEEP